MITLPRDFDPNTKYPVVVYGYSGPGSQTVANRYGRGLWGRYMNQEGYITFAIDPRGTGGRGTDFKYLSYKDIGKWVVTDQAEGAKYLKYGVGFKIVQMEITPRINNSNVTIHEKFIIKFL